MRQRGSIRGRATRHKPARILTEDVSVQHDSECGSTRRLGQPVQLLLNEAAQLGSQRLANCPALRHFDLKAFAVLRPELDQEGSAHLQLIGLSQGAGPAVPSRLGTLQAAAQAASPLESPHADTSVSACRR